MNPKKKTTLWMRMGLERMISKRDGRMVGRTKRMMKMMKAIFPYEHEGEF